MDLNQLDYKLWNILEKACKNQRVNLESLKRNIVKVVAEIPLQKIRTCIKQWPERLCRCIKMIGALCVLYLWLEFKLFIL